MKTVINKEKPVLVTGATGYVAGVLVKRLLEEGLTVHATVRDASNKERLQYLEAVAAEAPGQIRYFSADLLAEGSFAEAMEGCATVFHTASPFSTDVKDPQKDLVEPAQLGTRNVLEQANRVESVQRVVLTSSTVAIFGDNADVEASKTGAFTEQDWNTTSTLMHQPYSYSKTVAEQEAWNIQGKQDRWDLVTINPTLVVGPGINPYASGESYAIMKQFGDGTMKAGVPDYGMGIVDVRDVAEAHFQAAFRPDAKGRHLTSAADASFPIVGDILRKHFGSAYPFPKRIMPKWLVWLVGPMVDKALTRKVVARNINVPFVSDNRKVVEGLGVSFRPLEESVVEMFQQLVDHEVVKPIMGHASSHKA
ncbi:MAG: NAD-dependent epimerase/dehydratase family protein [Planctomycetota bacterium]